MKYRLVLGSVALLLVTCLLFTQAASASSTWLEYPTNPVYSDGSKAYYPCVLYNADRFSGHGDAYYYKMWYMNSASEYNNPLRCADSSDGITWVNDQAITQDASALLVTYPSETWFFSSYGPSAVLYNAGGYTTLNTADPMGNKYVLYYDACTQSATSEGTIECTALAVSADGVYWSRYGSEPVFKASGSSAWDSGYAYAWSVLKIGGAYYMYYSGGTSASNQGIGYATSSDGITWVKQPTPIFHVSDGVTWRAGRTYTPCVLYDASQFSGHGDACYYKMWFTGATASDTCTIGYAYTPSLYVTPESPIGRIVAVFACVGAVLIFKYRKGFR